MKNIKILLPILFLSITTTNFAWPPENQFWMLKAWFPTLTFENSVGLEIGDIAPEIEMAGVNGKTLKLSDLKGKVVLIDFWASWCGPCRYENPNVVEAYEKYKSAKFKNGKGFEIFSVSLDAYKEAWVKAIKQDKLNWKYHVADFKKWQNEAAVKYKVKSIPTNILIDADGVILAKNLRGMDLHIAIDNLVEKL